MVLTDCCSYMYFFTFLSILYNKHKINYGSRNYLQNS